MCKVIRGLTFHENSAEYEESQRVRNVGLQQKFKQDEVYSRGMTHEAQPVAVRKRRLI